MSYLSKNIKFLRKKKTIAAQAGYVNEFPQSYTDQNLIPISIPGIEGEARTFEITGGSMEPALIEGDYVVCRRVEHDGVYEKINTKIEEIEEILRNSKRID